MSHIVLSQFVVRSADGSVNEDSTVQKFRGALAQFIADRDTEETKIASAIEQVLSDNVGVRTNLDFVTGTVARALNATAATYGDLKNKAAEYIRQNACNEKDGLPIESKTGELLSEPRRYFLGKGRDGGVSRWADRLAMKAAKAASSTAK
jgi:hypothetical protein